MGNLSAGIHQTSSLLEVLDGGNGKTELTSGVRTLHSAFEGVDNGILELRIAEGATLLGADGKNRFAEFFRILKTILGGQVSQLSMAVLCDLRFFGGDSSFELLEFLFLLC